MKKALLIVLAVLISAFVPTVFAQAKSEAKQADRSVTASHEKTQVFEKKPDKPVEKTAPKAKTIKGEFVSMDAAARTMVVSDAKGEMTFDVTGIKRLVEFKGGDKIMVAYTEKEGKMIAQFVLKKAVKKDASKKEEIKTVPAPEKKQ